MDIMSTVRRYIRECIPSSGSPADEIKAFVRLHRVTLMLKCTEYLFQQ